MASLSKSFKKVKYLTQKRNRCRICGRPRGFIRFFALCRICVRKQSYQGCIAGIRKSSW